MGRLKNLILVLAVMVLLLCSACGVVNIAAVRAPAGDEPVHLRASDWEGVWLPYRLGMGGVPFFWIVKVTVIDPEKGWLRAEITISGEKGLQVTTTDLYLRRAGRWMLLSMRWLENNFYLSPDEALPFKGYAFGRAELNKDTLLVWAPRRERFAELVKKGVIAGSMHYKDSKSHSRLEIERLDTQVLKQFQASESMPADYWNQPVIYIRVSDISPNSPPDAQTEGP
jgi:hypothetical protein